MGHVLADLKYALRMLVKHPGLALVSIIALALGLGLTTTMWSIVYGALLRGLPFEDSDRIIAVSHTNPARHINRTSITIPDFDVWRRDQTSFEDLAGFYNGTVNLSGGDGRPERYDGAFVTPGVFRVLRVRPALGRVFEEAEGTVGGPNAVILGHDLWRTRFNGDPAAVGKTVRVNGASAQIVGVMPAGFKFPIDESIWVPLRVDRLTITRERGNQLLVVGRLKPGVSVARAVQDLTAIDGRLATEFPKTNAGFKPLLESFTDSVIGPQPRTMLWTMLGAVFGVLLIACSNVANLLLARAAMRTKEVAVRTALGANRWRIVSQLLAEALVLAFAGALVGLGIAVYGVHLFNAALVDTHPPFFIRIAVDAPVLAFVTAISVLAAAVAGVLPALQATGTRVSEVLKDESRGASSMRLGKFARGLVIAEIALSCGLLIGAGFMTLSVVKRSHFDYGVPTRTVFTARVALFESNYPDSAVRQVFWRDLAQRLEALPDQQGVALMTSLPGVGTGTTQFEIEGKDYPDAQTRPETRALNVSAGYFSAFKQRALEGRVLNSGDIGGALPVVVVSRQFAQKHFPGTSALGRRLRLGASDTTFSWRTIVGVVPDVWYQGTDDKTPETILLPFAQTDQRYVSVVVAGGHGDPMRFAEPVRAAVAALDPDQPIYFVNSLQARIDQNGWFYDVFGALFMVFGVAALFLATIGVYGVMSFAVTRRTQEVGVRMALGAAGRDVLRLFLRQGAIQVSVGLVIGLGLALLLAQGLQVVLFQVDTKNPAVFAVVMGVLALTGLAAVLIPARRAARVDPVTALRYD
jgi:putative ABC transport system permease protein